MSDSAFYHAKRCLELCRKHKIGDFDLAFAYEALARACALGRNKSESKRYVELASVAGERIKEKEDRDLFFNDLPTIPG